MYSSKSTAALKKVPRSLKSFAFRSSFKTWVYRIAANTAINHCKRLARHTSGRVEYDPAVTDIKVSDPRDAALDRQDAAEAVARLIGSLDPDQRACIVLREMQGFDYQAIADTLNININTVRSRLKRARQKLFELARKG
jgi:RNA polymerase sigma-70 factor, ECF subfamily